VSPRVEAAHLPPAAFLVGLAGLPRMGPRRFRALLAGRSPRDAWGLVVEGRVTELAEVAEALHAEGRTLPQRWANAAGRTDLEAMWRHHLDRGVRVLTEDSDLYPEVFRHDPEPPAVLFVRGDPERLEGIRVAVVGTRRCTQYGRDVASQLGRELAAAGARVVSGLALGIDAAAHAGALGVDGAPPIAVVGNGLDITYPRRNARLYACVVERGVLLSEYPLGTQPRTWTFPARNRLVAALARVVVVVESHAKGGSQWTVDEADRRDIEVRAVPGSVRSPASVGPNLLIAEGKLPVLDTLDLLLPLGLVPARPSEGPTGFVGTGSASSKALPAVPPHLRGLLDAIGWEATSLEQLLLRTQLGLAVLHGGLAELEDLGAIRWDGNWVERCAP
jgi:DNA processing protein